MHPLQATAEKPSLKTSTCAARMSGSPTSRAGEARSCGTPPWRWAPRSGVGSGDTVGWGRVKPWIGLSLVLCVGLVSLSCATTPEGQVRNAARLERDGKRDEARDLLEKTVKEAPENVAVHVALGGIYLNQAQEALGKDEEEPYVTNLALCQQEALRALELDPDSAPAHTLLAIVAIYRGDIKAAASGFNLAVQLDPVNWQHYLNLAEMEIYRGNLNRARRNIDLARRFRAPAGEVELVEVLCAWKLGDFTEARDIFDDVALLEPEVARTWNGASDIQTFEDMAAHCCKLEFCGPYMQRACKQMDQQAAERKRAVETARKELELEAERQRRLKDVYRDRRDIEIEVQDD